MSRLNANHAVLSALLISCWSMRVVMGGDCGCDYQQQYQQQQCQTVHIHRHLFGHCHHCNSYIPSGMVVPSVAAMPVAAMPMAAMTVAAAPMAAMPVQAPTYQLVPQQAPRSCGSDTTLQDTIVRNFMDRAFSPGGPLAAPAAPNGSASSLDDKIDRIEKNLASLAKLTEHVSDALKSQDDRIKALEKVKGITK